MNWPNQEAVTYGYTFQIDIRLEAIASGLEAIVSTELAQEEHEIEAKVALDRGSVVVCCHQMRNKATGQIGES